MDVKVVRVLEAFRKDKGALVFEVPLSDLNLETLQRIFGVPKSDPMHDCWPVKEENLPLLRSHVDCSIALDCYDYFVSAYTEPSAL